MRAVAICCTVGRASVEELLAMWALQSVQLPLLLALDVPAARWLPEAPVGGWLGGCEEWVVQRAPACVRREAYPRTIGPLRAWAVEQAVKLWQLDERQDAFLVLDDDDFYSPEHARETMRALSENYGYLVGARNTGIITRPHQPEPELVLGGPYGPGPHATWGVPLRTYRAAGGYQTDPSEDTALLSRVGWQFARAHDCLTHVRTQLHTATFSSEEGHRDRLEVAGELQLMPRLTPRVEALARWCAAQRA